MHFYAPFIRYKSQIAGRGALKRPRFFFAGGLFLPLQSKKKNMIDRNLFESKKIAYHSLGCKLNFAETSSLGKMMEASGYVRIRPGEIPDVCVINTCSVRNRR